MTLPVAVFLLGASFGLEELSMKMMGTMTIISAGVSIASYGEVNFNWIGVVYMMGGVVGEAFRLIFIELLLKRKGLKLDPIIMMYYVSPCSALCLFVPWLILEKPKMDAAVQWHFDPVIMTLNALCTFALNVSVFLVISHTSALTIRVAGVIKDWVVVLVSVYLFADAKLTVINIFGYVIAIFGVYLYNAQKLNEAAVTSASNSTQESQGLLGVSNTTQHKYKST
uniref:Sugar phosphate transporter domain-containing protein n=1 Tax=Physcomitrium patens TaxID=3218 RepID=A0A7I3ZYS5_PHYPA